MSTTKKRKLRAILFADINEVQFCEYKTECPMDIRRSEPQSGWDGYNIKKKS